MNLKNTFAWAAHLRSRRPRRHPRHLWRRRRLSALILLAVIVAASAAWLYISADPRIRMLAIRAVENLSGGDVEIDSAQLRVLRQIRIQGFRLYLPDRPHTPDTLVLEAQDVILEHQVLSLLGRRLALSRVVATDPSLHIWYNPATNLTNLSLLRFRDQPVQRGPKPTVTLRNAVLSYREVIDGGMTRPARQSLSGQVIPDPDDPALVHFHFKALPQSALPEAELHGVYNLRTRHIESTGSFLLQRVDFANLPDRVEQFRQLYQLSQPAGRVRTESSFDPNLGQVVDITLDDGQLRLPLPDVDIPLSHVSAVVRCTPEAILIRNITGRYEDFATFFVTGRVAGYDRDAPFDLNIRTEGLTIAPDAWQRYSDLADPNLPADPLETLEPPLAPLAALLDASARNILAEITPTGRYDLDLHVAGPVTKQTKDIQYSAVVTARDAAVCPDRFPYPVRNLNGTIHLDPTGLELGPLTAVMGDHEVRIEARYRPPAVREPDQPELVLDVATRNTPLDDTLYQALRPWQKNVYNRFDPAGCVDADYHAISFPGQPWQETLRFEFSDADVTYEPFPVPLKHAAGFLRYEDDQAAFRIDRANAQQGNVTLDGAVTAPGSPRPDFTATIHFDAIRLDPPFARLLPDRLGDFYRILDFNGAVTGIARIAGGSSAPQQFLPDLADESNLSLYYHIEADFADAALRYHVLPYALTDATGHVEFTNHTFRVHSLRARHNDSQLDLTASLDADRTYSLHLNADPLVLDADLRASLPTSVAPTYDRYQPAGRVRLGLDLARDLPASSDHEISADPNAAPTLAAPTQYAADITLLDAAARPYFFPYLLTSLTGTIHLDPNVIRFDNLIASPAPARVALTGSLRREPSDSHTTTGTTTVGLLNLTASDLPLDANLRDALPVSFRPFVDRLKPTGRADVRLRLVQPDHPQAAWNLQADIALADTRLAWPYPFDIPALTLTGTADYTPAENAFNATGSLNAPALSVAQRPVAALAAQVAYNAADKRLAFQDVAATLCNGRLAGQLFTWLTADPVPYELRLQLTDADLPSLLEAATPPDQRRHNLKGSITGWLRVAQPQAMDSRRGSFLFVISDAVLGQLPITASILHVLNVSLPREGAFNEASIAGNVLGRKVLFDPITLRGSALALAGAGVMSDPNNSLELIFVTQSPHNLPDIPLVSSFLRAINPELAQVRVSGTWHDPRVEPVAFPSLEAAFREFAPDLPRPTPQRRVP